MNTADHSSQPVKAYGKKKSFVIEYPPGWHPQQWDKLGLKDNALTTLPQPFSIMIPLTA